MFRLEKVLRWKSTLEKEARQKRLEMEHRVESLERQLAASKSRRQNAPDSLDGLDDLLEWSRYLEGMRRVEVRLAERLHDLRPALAERVRLHQELRRDVKGLEKLSQKEKARAHEAWERRAQESLDEVAARRSLPHGGKSFRASRP